MKTPVSSSWIPGLILITASLSVSFAQSDLDRLAKLGAEPSRVASPSQAAPSFPAISAAKDSPAFPLPENDASVVRRQPPKLRLSPWTSEVVKLAESGVETSVILAFIENSGTFNLGADQIVYLHDLGLSGEIINTMLQHDRDLITGARPLTITSDPEWQFPFDSNPAAGKDALGMRLPNPSATLDQVAATASPDSAPAHETLLEINRPLAVAAVAATESAAQDEPAIAAQSTFAWQTQSTDRKKNPYPVREPYPVEITSPIVFINADGRIPNTLVVLGFPRATP